MHGNLLDAAEYQNLHPESLVDFSPGEAPNSGGVGILVAKAFAAQFTTIVFHPLVPGRIVSALFCGLSGNLRITNIHLVPAWTDAVKKQKVIDTLKVMAPEPRLTNYLLGDFNVIRPGERRMHPDSLDKTVLYDPFSEWFEG